MSLDVKILGLDQKVDFSDGSISNVVRLELPSGAHVVALVTDEGAQQVLAAVQASKNVFKERPVQAAPPQPAQVAPRVTFAPRPANVQPPAFEFGGDGPGIDQPEDEDEPVVQPQLGPPMARVRAPASDEAGNPIDAQGTPFYEREPAAPPQEEERDEDGVRGL
jgi:hypothetical protein